MDTGGLGLPFLCEKLQRVCGEPWDGLVKKNNAGICEHIHLHVHFLSPMHACHLPNASALAQAVLENVHTREHAVTRSHECFFTW